MLEEEFRIAAARDKCREAQFPLVKTDGSDCQSRALLVKRSRSAVQKASPEELEENWFLRLKNLKKIKRASKLE